MICRWSLKGEAESFSSEIRYFLFSLNIYSSPFSTQNFEYGFLILQVKTYMKQFTCILLLKTFVDKCYLHELTFYNGQLLLLYEKLNGLLCFTILPAHIISGFGMYKFVSQPYMNLYYNLVYS